MTTLREKYLKGLHDLGADRAEVEARNLPLYADATALVVADVSQSGFEHKLTDVAASAWVKLKQAALADNVSLILVSGFRSFERQFAILNRRIEQGDSISELFKKLAPPGCSQHHTGRAIDIGTLGCEPASLDFSNTEAFFWLEQHAADFGFEMPYPQDNVFGYLYEPWHWYLSE